MLFRSKNDMVPSVWPAVSMQWITVLPRRISSPSSSRTSGRTKYLPHQPEDEEIDEFCVKQYERLADLKDDDLLEADIYLSLIHIFNFYPTFPTSWIYGKGPVFLLKFSHNPRRTLKIS